jgi:hypothetical protein
MVSRNLLRQLRQAAEGDGVIVTQQDGTTKAFSRMEVMKQLYLARLATTGGQEIPQSAVLNARANATPESRRMLDAMAARVDNGIGDLEPLDAEVAKEEVVDLSEGESFSP